YLRDRSTPSLVICLFAALFYLDRIVFAGRRGVMVEFGMIVILALWFQRRVAIPRAVMLAGFIVGALLLYPIADYRGLVMGDNPFRTALRDKGKVLTWEEVSSIPFVNNLYAVLTRGGPELTNSVYMIEATDQTGYYDWGLFHWNTIIFNYVP